MITEARAQRVRGAVAVPGGGPLCSCPTSTGARQACEAVVGMTPLGRLGQPPDAAGHIAFLAVRDGRWITAVPHCENQRLVR